MCNNQANINTPKKLIDKLILLQLNTSNADWETKKYELITTIENNNADVTIISESNAEINNDERMDNRKSMFSAYNIEDKVILGQSKARVSIVIKKEIYYKRCKDLESDENSMIVIRFNETKDKFVHLVGTYREWRHLRGPDATSSAGINLQKQRILQLKKLMTDVKESKQRNTLIWAGDLNCDKNQNNDPMTRPDIRVIYPIFNDIISNNNLAQMNHKNTWHRPGRKSSLLDLFFTDKPHRVTKVENTVNILSEHEGVIMHFDCKAQMRQKQFFIKRDYRNLTWENIENDVNHNPDLQSLFSENDPEKITEKLLRGLNSVIKKHIKIKRVQITNNMCPYWNTNLAESLNRVSAANAMASMTGTQEDERHAKHLRNVHTRMIKKTAKKYYLQKFQKKNSEFRALKTIIPDENKIPVMIIKDGKTYTKPAEVANVVMDSLIDKVEKIREEVKGDHYEAIKTYKHVIPRVESEMRFKRRTVIQVYEAIMKQKSTNSKGNDEITPRILKMMPHYSAIAICHLFNNIIRTGIFPSGLKTSRITPLLKPGKVATDSLSYRPISNLNSVEKVIEELLKEDLEEFLENNKIIPENNHGARKGHSTVTAKAVLDKEINDLRDKNKSVAITTTDLTAAFDTCDSLLLTNMMEHIGIRGTELETLTNYLMNRTAYIEIQGFFSTLRKMPNCSVIQGSKMSSTLYTIYTLDSTKVDLIMKDPEKFKEIVKRDLVETNEPEHTTVGFVDDVTHVTGLNNKDEQEVYLNELYSLLINMYTNKRLQINGSKTKILTIINNKDDGSKIKIRIDDNNEISESETIKILGFQQNRRNTMDTHLNTVSSNVGMLLAKLKPALTYMPDPIKKRIIQSKVKSVATYGLQLIIGQPQSIIQRACAILMNINRKMFTNIEGLRSTSAICRKLNLDEPRQEILKSGFKLIHKMIETRKPEQIVNKLKIPSRKSSKVYMRDGIRSVRASRSPLNAALELYNAIPANFRVMNHKKMKRDLKKVSISYSLFK